MSDDSSISAFAAAAAAAAADGGKAKEKETLSEGGFRNDLFEKFSFTHAAIVNAEPEWLKMYRKTFGISAPADLIRCDGNPPADWLNLESLDVGEAPKSKAVKNDEEIDVDDDDDDDEDDDADDDDREEKANVAGRKTSSSTSTARPPHDSTHSAPEADGDVDDEFGDAAGSTAKKAPSDSLTESRTKLLLNDIDDEFGETTIDVDPKIEPTDETVGKGRANRDKDDADKTDGLNVYEIPEALKRKMFGMKGHSFGAKIVNELTRRCIIYEGTQAIEYPRHSGLTAQDQRDYLNFYLQKHGKFRFPINRPIERLLPRVLPLAPELERRFRDLQCLVDKERREYFLFVLRNGIETKSMASRHALTTDAVLDFSSALIKKTLKLALETYKGKYAPMTDAGKVENVKAAPKDDETKDDDDKNPQKTSPPPPPVYHKTVSLRKPTAAPGAPALRCLATPLQIGTIPRAHVPKIETDADYKEIKNLDFSGGITDVLGKTLVDRLAQRFLLDTVREGGVGGEDGKDDVGGGVKVEDTAGGVNKVSGEEAEGSRSMDSTVDSIQLTKSGENAGKPFLRKPLSSRDMNAEKIAVKYRTSIVTSPSAIKCLVNNNDAEEINLLPWHRTFQLPVVVKEYQLHYDADFAANSAAKPPPTHKVVYLDKPLPNVSYTPKELNEKYIKYAFREIFSNSTKRPPPPRHAKSFQSKAFFASAKSRQKRALSPPKPDASSSLNDSTLSGGGGNNNNNNGRKNKKNKAGKRKRDTLNRSRDGNARGGRGGGRGGGGICGIGANRGGGRGGGVGASRRDGLGFVKEDGETSASTSGAPASTSGVGEAVKTEGVATGGFKALEGGMAAALKRTYQSFVKGEVLQPNQSPVEFFVPEAMQPKQSVDEAKAAKRSLLDLLPPSPKGMPQVDGPGDSDEEIDAKNKEISFYGDSLSLDEDSEDNQLCIDFDNAVEKSASASLHGDEALAGRRPSDVATVESVGGEVGAFDAANPPDYAASLFGVAPTKKPSTTAASAPRTTTTTTSSAASTVAAASTEISTPSSMAAATPTITWSSARDESHAMDLPLPKFVADKKSQQQQQQQQRRGASIDESADFVLFSSCPESPVGREKGSSLSRTRPVMIIPLENDDPRKNRNAAGEGGGGGGTGAAGRRPSMDEDKPQPQQRQQHNPLRQIQHKPSHQPPQPKPFPQRQKTPPLRGLSSSASTSQPKSQTSTGKSPRTTPKTSGVKMIDLFPMDDAATATASAIDDAAGASAASSTTPANNSPSMRQRLALSRKARLSSEDVVDGDAAESATSNVSSKVKRKQKLSKNEQLMMEVYGEMEERKRSKPNPRSAASNAAVATSSSSISTSTVNSKKPSLVETITPLPEPVLPTSASEDALTMKDVKPVGSDEAASSIGESATNAVETKVDSQRPETMAEKLKRLMKDESLPTPTLSSEKRQEYTSTLHKVVGSGSVKAAAAPMPRPGGGGAAATGQGGPLMEDPSLYQHPEDPGAFNIQYSLWSIGAIGMLMRSSVDAFLPPGVDGVMRNHGVTFSTKLEYMAKFGCTKLSYEEAVKEWADVTFSQTTKCFRGRINAYYGKPMLFEDLYPPNLEEELRSTCRISSDDVSQFLFNVFDELLQLPQGEYLLHHESGKDHAEVLRAVGDEEAHTLDLQTHESIASSSRRVQAARTSISNFPLLPLDPSILLFFHKANGRVPATFQPRDFEPGFFTKAKAQRTEAKQTKRMAKRAEAKRKYEAKKRKDLEERMKLDDLTQGVKEEEVEEAPVEGYQPTGFKFGQMS